MFHLNIIQQSHYIKKRNTYVSLSMHLLHFSFKSVTTCSAGVSIIRRRHDGDRYGREMFIEEYFGERLRHTQEDQRDHWGD